jgi:hypothetical protein
MDVWNMPLLMELGNVLECDFYKAVAPDGADWPAQWRRDAAAAGLIFSRQNFCRAQSQK